MIPKNLSTGTNVKNETYTGYGPYANYENYDIYYTTLLDKA